MALPAFDTHAYVKRLRLAGFSEQQAEAQAELNAQVLSELVTEKLTTKDDISNMATKDDISNLKHEVNLIGSKLNWLLAVIGFLGLVNLAHLFFSWIHIQ